jgi:integrase
MTIFRRPGSPNWYFDFIVEGSRHAGSTKTANRREAADLFAVLLDTGMRLGEAVSLECRDVNLETGLTHVWKNKSDRPRSIPMTERVRGIVEPRLASGRPRVFLLSCADVEGVWRRSPSGSQRGYWIRSGNMMM